MKPCLPPSTPLVTTLPMELVILTQYLRRSAQEAMRSASCCSPLQAQALLWDRGAKTRSANSNPTPQLLTSRGHRTHRHQSRASSFENFREPENFQFVSLQVTKACLQRAELSVLRLSQWHLLSLAIRWEAVVVACSECTRGLFWLVELQRSRKNWEQFPGGRLPARRQGLRSLWPEASE